MEQLPLPTSLDEVEQLIRALYQPNTPETISKIQEVLQRLQRSPEGWQLAQSLIAHREDNIRFYAALTLIVKLNRDSASLSEDDASGLLESIIGWTIQALVDGAGAFVVKKLCSALITYFVQFSHIWPNCLRHFIYCLDLGRGSRAEALDDALTSEILVQNLDSQKLKVAIWFTTSLVEEVGKTDMNSAKYIDVHTRLAKNGHDVACLLARGFAPASDNAGIQTQAETISCYQAWILYAQRATSNTDLLITPLRQLVDPAMQCFATAQLFQATAELFSDVLSNYSAFFTEAHYTALSALFDSPWAVEHYQRILHGNHQEDGISFGLLMLAYGDAKVQDLMEGTDDRSRRFMESLSGLLATDGYLVAEDSIFVPALEFWSTFIETMIDSAFSDEQQTQVWKPYAEQHLKAVVVNCWRKIQWPPADVFADWDSSERVAFSDARKDVADMLQSLFTLEGLDLISFFAGLFLQAMEAQTWAELEATAFCLGALSDCISEDERFDTELSKVFASPFFELLGRDPGAIPLRLRQTGLSLIERYCEYFERHAEYLPSALNLLFAAVGDSVLGGPSARSISTLCSSCRSILTGEAGAFIRHYQTIRSSQVLDSLAEERIVLAIAFTIQSIKDEDQRLQTFEELYNILKKDFQLAVELRVQPGLLNLSNPDHLRGLDPPSPQAVPPVDEISLHIALRSMRCLANVAKGMQDVQESIVDLDSAPKTRRASSKLANLQADIMNVLVEVQRAFSANGEIIEIICNIFRAGFSESEPGPFVFPAEVVTDYFVQQPFQTPRVGTLLSTACSYVGSLYRGPKVIVPAQLRRLLPWVIMLLQTLPEPGSDTEVAQNGICLIDKVMSKYPEVIFQIQPQQLLEFFFLFTLKVLNGKEPLPKIAAADFWSNFITLKPTDPTLATQISNAMSHLGPLVTQTLINNIGGNAARSELDRLSEPLKKLVTSQVQAQAWLERALMAESSINGEEEGFPAADRVTPQERYTFMKKILALRGARQTNVVVREFWLQCRGSSFAYVS
ncbi:putative importin [Podospora australis]|uniref:Importin n=1 Tax=Podospora australis TaxID=1536484 RepID=A0AAN6X033_9PEZI|nr:putative importin [Podospora australis]